MLYILISVFACALFYKYPQLLWILIPFWIFWFIKDVILNKSKKPYEEARRINGEIHKFVENEICLKNKALYKKFLRLRNDAGYGLPPPEFAALIKDKERRHRYCSMSISSVKAQIESHKPWDSHNFIGDLKPYAVVSISIISGAIVMNFFGLVVGVIAGALTYWAIHKEIESAKVHNHFADTQAKPITNEWNEVLIKFQKAMAEIKE
jgi:hypothetical protein